MESSSELAAADPAWSQRRVARLVRAHQRALAAYLESLGCPSRQVEDLVQDTFLRLLRSPFEERSERETRAYLRTVARNLFVESLRRDGARVPTVELAAADEAWAGFERHDLGASYLAALRECLTTLSARTRSILHLRYHEAVGRDEIAGRFGLSLGGVKSVLLRAKLRLKECVERRLEA